MKTFIPKNKEIPVLKSYGGTLPDSYWAHWTKRSFETVAPATSWVDPRKLRNLARRIGYKSNRLTRVLKQLSEGAKIGCKGDARLPTKMPNSKSALVYGERVADSLQDWIKEGIAFGPLLPEEMPWTDYSVNPILVRLKPNGKARIIVNMSSPYPK